MFRYEKGWFRISVIGCHITEYFKHLVLRKRSINAFSLVPFDSSGIRFSSCSNIEDLHVEAASRGRSVSAVAELGSLFCGGSSDGGACVRRGRIFVLKNSVKKFEL